MIKILHTADWHLGQTFFNFDRTDEHRHFLEWLLKELKEEKVDVLIIAGDVFDVSNPSAASQRMFYQFIQQATSQNPHLQIVAVAGNHDSPARLESPIPLLETMNTHIRGLIKKNEEGTIDYDHLLLELNNADGKPELLCLAVPFLRQGDYPHVETDGNAYAEGVSLFYHQLLEAAVARKKEGQAIVAIGHLQMTGSEIAEKDYSERTIIGGLECVSPVIFTEEVAYTALGHIHKSQRVSKRENVRYSGSPLPMSFAEKNYHHGVEIVTFDKGELLSIEKKEIPRLIPLVSVPRQGVAPLNDVLQQLSELEVATDVSPYLEVKVALEDPDPTIVQQISDVIAHKNYRLVRVQSSYISRTENKEEDEEVDWQKKGLADMHPLQLFEKVYYQHYQSELSDELKGLFNEVYNEAIKEQEELD